MENTRQNKEYFFANYYGQKVLKVSEDAIVTQKADACFLNRLEVYQTCHLELMPLSTISDEDAIEVARIVYRNPDIHKVEMGKNFIDTMNGGEAYHSGYFKHYTVLSVSDFLRSKSYALPFHDLSIEDLVNFGWVKLKTNA